MKHFKILFALVITATMCMCAALSASAAEDAQTTRHYFTQTTSTQKITWFVEGEKVVATASFGGRNLDYSKHYYEMKNDYTSLYFYRLKTDRSGIEKIPVYRDKVYTLQNGEWVLTYDGSKSGYVSYSDLTYNTQYYDFTDSGIDILEFNMTDRGTAFNKGTMSMDYKSVNHSTETNIYSYLLNGTFTDFGKNYVFLLHENLIDIVPQMYRSSSSTLTNSTVSISVDYDEENGIVSWSDFAVDEENTLKKGVIASFYYKGDKGYGTDYYRTILTGTSYKISLGGCDFSDSTMRYRQITFIPYYIHTNGTLYFGKSSYITIDEDSTAATRSADKILTATAKASDKPSSIVPDKGDIIADPDSVDRDSTYSAELGYLQGVTWSCETNLGDVTTPIDTFYLYDKITWNTSKDLGDAYIQLKSEGRITYKDSSGNKRQKKVKFDIYSYNDRIAYDEGLLTVQGGADMQIAQDKYDGVTSYIASAFYIRLIRYNNDTSSWEHGGWVKISLTSNDSYEISTGEIDERGTYKKDSESDGSYSYKQNGLEQYVPSGTDSSILPSDAVGWFTSTLEKFVAELGSVPLFFTTIFGFLPTPIIALLGIFIVVCIILRVAGR